MRNARLGLLFALAGCQAAGLAPSAAVPPQASGVRREATPDTRSGHVFVAVTSATHYPSVERFHLVNGVPESTPDRTYDGYGFLIAVSTNGTLYSFGQIGDYGIYAFSPRSNKPARRIEIHSPEHCGLSSGGESTISAIATDAKGYLFAAIYSYDGGATARTRPLAPAASTRVPCDGVVVLAPNAKGKAKPVQTITLGRHTIITGIAVDHADNLYITEDPYKIVEFANAVAAPERTRVFHTKAPAHVSSIATDDAGNVFISNVNYGYKTGWIDRYAPAANGKGPPNSRIMLEGSRLHFLLATAVRRRELFAVDTFDQVDVYHARAKGPQSPFYSFPANDASSIATGP